MKATISMSRNSLWKMIQAMSLNADNKLWLGEKLIEEARKEVAETAPCQYSVEELEHRLGESVQSYRKGDCCTSDDVVIHAVWDCRRNPDTLTAETH